MLVSLHLLIMFIFMAFRQYPPFIFDLLKIKVNYRTRIWYKYVNFKPVGSKLLRRKKEASMSYIITMFSMRSWLVFYRYKFFHFITISLYNICQNFQFIRWLLMFICDEKSAKWRNVRIVLSKNQPTYVCINLVNRYFGGIEQNNSLQTYNCMT